MIEKILDLLKEINIFQLIAIACMMWYSYSRLNEKIENLDKKFEIKFEKLSEKVEDIDRRLCRIEGSLSSQRYCQFTKEAKPE